MQINTRVEPATTLNSKVWQCNLNKYIRAQMVSKKLDFIPLSLEEMRALIA